MGGSFEGLSIATSWCWNISQEAVWLWTISHKPHPWEIKGVGSIVSNCLDILRNHTRPCCIQFRINENPSNICVKMCPRSPALLLLPYSRRPVWCWYKGRWCWVGIWSRGIYGLVYRSGVNWVVLDILPCSGRDKRPSVPRTGEIRVPTEGHSYLAPLDFGISVWEKSPTKHVKPTQSSRPIKSPPDTFLLLVIFLSLSPLMYPSLYLV